jgi:porin
MFTTGFSPATAQETPSIINTRDETSPTAPPSASARSWLERDTLTGDWGGGRLWLTKHGITLKPRLTQFYQGLSAGDGDQGFEYGGKVDILLNADLSKLGFWSGFSITAHAEYNFGQSVNGHGLVIEPVNTALYFPGIEGSDRFDLSSVYLGQTFGKSASLVFGKINMIDIAGSHSWEAKALMHSGMLPSLLHPAARFRPTCLAPC